MNHEITVQHGCNSTAQHSTAQHSAAQNIIMNLAEQRKCNSNYGTLHHAPLVEAVPEKPSSREVNLPKTRHAHHCAEKRGLATLKDLCKLGIANAHDTLRRPSRPAILLSRLVRVAVCCADIATLAPTDTKGVDMNLCVKIGASNRGLSSRAQEGLEDARHKMRGGVATRRNAASVTSIARLPGNEVDKRRDRNNFAIVLPN